MFASGVNTACPAVKIQPERLPDLNIPRTAHHVLCLNGEVTAIGGHTTAFIPTPTLEYYKDGEWHVLQMAYAHNDAIVVPLSSGKVLIAGGYEKPLGIGQTYSTEIYDPVTHTFGDFGCLDRKRAQSMGVELDSGKVMIAGNWYHDDGIEMFDGHKSFAYVKDVETGYGHPFLLRTAKDDAIIFGSFSIKGDSLQSSTVERLKGDPVNVPLLEQWHPKCMYIPNNSADYFIGDAKKGIYSYLIPVDGKTCVVVGRSDIVGKPMGLLLLQRHGTVIYCHRHTRDLGAMTRLADILIVAAGHRGLITADMVKEGAVVIDVAMNRDAVTGKFTGDVCFDEVKDRCSHITPVPGGVGPMTRAMLMKNVLTLARLHMGLPL